MGAGRFHRDDIRNEPALGGLPPVQPSGTQPEPPLSPASSAPPHAASGVDLVCWRCGYSRAGLSLETPCPECSSPAFKPHDMDPDASVWDEPTTSAALSGQTPEDATTYARWLDARLAERDVGKSWALTGLIALAAGPLAVMGAFWGSGQTTLSVLAIVVFGPVVEEASKLALPTFIVERKPHLFVSRAQILVCGGAAGLAFAAIENLLYLHVYVPNPSAALVAWRWTVCVALHVGCSMIGAIGLALEWHDAIGARRKPDLVRAARWLTIAAVTHGAYNGLAVALGSTGFAP